MEAKPIQTNRLCRDQVLAILAAHQEELRELGVKSLALFGSVARDEARPDSDVDLLIEFESGRSPQGFAYADKMLKEAGEITQRYPDYWYQMKGMRNRLVHNYANVDPETVWKVIQADLPLLVPQLQELLEREKARE